VYQLFVSLQKTHNAKLLLIILRDERLCQVILRENRGVRTPLVLNSLHYRQQSPYAHHDQWLNEDIQVHPHLTIDRDAHRVTADRSEEHTSELQSRFDIVCRLLLEKKKLSY